MTLRVDVKPELFRWARERAGIEPDALVKRFPKYREWESGEKQPTFKQLKQLAKATHAPIGSFFLSEPMQEPVPLPDLRTVGLPSVDPAGHRVSVSTKAGLVPGIRPTASARCSVPNGTSSNTCGPCLIVPCRRWRISFRTGSRQPMRARTCSSVGVS